MPNASSRPLPLAVVGEGGLAIVGGVLLFAAGHPVRLGATWTRWPPASRPPSRFRSSSGGCSVRREASGRCRPCVNCSGRFRAAVRAAVAARDGGDQHPRRHRRRDPLPRRGAGAVRVADRDGRVRPLPPRIVAARLGAGAWAAMAGGVLAGLAIATGGLVAPIVAHAGYDFAALLGSAGRPAGRPEAPRESAAAARTPRPEAGGVRDVDGAATRRSTNNQRYCSEYAMTVFFENVGT